MPTYEYYCRSNDRRVTVQHPMDLEVRDWGMLCYISQISVGDTDSGAAVRRLPGAPAVHLKVGNSGLKERGFTKLVRRDEGVYENVTALDREARYFVAGRPETIPHVHKKAGD